MWVNRASGELGGLVRGVTLEDSGVVRAILSGGALRSGRQE